MARQVEQLDNGVAVYQVTEGAVLADNIYCEASYCTPDSRWFVYRRFPQPNVAKWKQPLSEFVAVEFGAWRERVLGRGHYFPAIAPCGALFIPEDDDSRLARIVRVDISTGARNVVAPLSGDLNPLSTFAVSSDERLICFGNAISYSPQLFGIQRLDLASGRMELLFASPSIYKPHVQFEPFSHELLIQDNRGCRFKPDGTTELKLGPEGCTLFALNADNGVIRPLRVGPPYTPSATGHEQWVGRSGEAIVCIDAPWSDGQREGCLIVARPGLYKPRVVGEGGAHVHTDGRHYCVDAFSNRGRGERDLVVGSLSTQRTVVVGHCRVGPIPPNAPPVEHQIHGHPYLSPDNRWLVFNCWRTGRPQVYAASLPPDLLAALD